MSSLSFSRYSLFIFSFALAFYILLHKDYGEGASESEDDSDDYPFFNGLGSTLVKTFTMFVGELEFADLPFNTGFGYGFFLVFIFLIVVVMMNLLNGLAVSDTGIIREEAEITFYIVQVEVISYIESMLLGDPFNFLSNWPAFIWLRRFPSCSLGNTLYRVPPLRKIFHRLTGASGVLLFFDYLPEKRITFFPNHDVPFCGCLAGEDKDKDFHASILEASKAVTLSKKLAQDGLEERFTRTEEKLSRTEEKLAEMIKENRSMNDKLEQILSLVASR